MEEIGRLLKEKRLELGLTIEEVSDQTRLTQKHIKALEEGDIGFFHDDLSYLRFFVKSYCDVLGLDFEDIKDELRKDVNDYTMTFTTSAQINHEEIEKNIAKSEKLSKVSTANVKTRQKRRFRKPDMSLVSLIAIVEEEQQKEEEKEISISKTDATHYTIENLKDGDELKFEVTFAGSSSGFSASVDGDVLKDPKAQIYEYNSTAKGNIKVKKGMKLELYVMYNTQLKINDKNVKLDDSIVNSSETVTIVFEIAGDSNESSK